MVSARRPAVSAHRKSRAPGLRPLANWSPIRNYQARGVGRREETPCVWPKLAALFHTPPKTGSQTYHGLMSCQFPASQWPPCSAFPRFVQFPHGISRVASKPLGPIEVMGLKVALATKQTRAGALAGDYVSDLGMAVLIMGLKFSPNRLTADLGAMSWTGLLPCVPSHCRAWVQQPCAQACFL